MDAPPPPLLPEPPMAGTIDAPLPPPPPHAMRGHGTAMHHGPMHSGPLPGMPVYGGPQTYPYPVVAYPGAYPGSPYGPGYAGAPFERDAWLADCHDRIRGVRRKDRAGVIGGLLGAIAGGVAGNRIADGNRLAGTLIGGGVGGLAGIAIGNAIGAAGDRRRGDECAWQLDRYMAAGHPGYGYGYPGYGYGYGYTMVPVLVAVPQRQVVREYVTEEYVDEPVRARTVTRSWTERRAAPAPDKRLKIIKAR